jgi:dienelactone hydrolase
MHANNAVFLVFIILFTGNGLIAQDQTIDYQQGLVTISYDDTEFKRPFTQWTLDKLNSDSVRWHGSNDWALRCLGYIESPFSGEITILVESDNYLRLDIDGETILEVEKQEKNRYLKVIMEKSKKYALDIYYKHDGGNSFMRFYWSWDGQEKILIPGNMLTHTDENTYIARKIYDQARAAIVKSYLTVPNLSPKKLPSLEAWQRGKQTLIGITFPNIPDFTCDAWCYESEVDLVDIISLNQGRMKLIHKFRTHPHLYMVTLITPEPGAVTITAWVEKNKHSNESLPDNILLPNICWQLKRARTFTSEPEPYPEFIKRCFIITGEEQTFLNETNRKKIPVRAEDEDVNNPPWVQNYIRSDKPLPEYDPTLWAAYSDTKFSHSIIGAVSRDKKYLAAVANNSSLSMCQAWHDCVHNNPQWLPENASVDQQIWQLKIYVMENDIKTLIKKVKEDFPKRDTISPDDVKKLKKQGTYGNTYQTKGTIKNLPVFLHAARARQTYPLSWLSVNEEDFNEWKTKARNIYRATWQTLPDDIPFAPAVLDEQDRGSYMAQKIALNITADSRILTYLLKPKGDGPFPAVLLLHDHSAIFDNGKEKVIKPWEISQERINSAQALAEISYGGRFIGDELAKRGYVCFAIDALNWGDRGGGGMEGQQAIGSNMVHLGMSFAGLIAHEDQRSVSYLASLPFVDEDRMAAMGLSMGAYRTWQVAAMSDKIKAGVAICWMATNDGLISYFNNQTKGNSAYSMLHPGLFNYLDYPDVASMACPKPMLFFNGEQDKLFPIHAVNAAYEKMQQIWDSQAAGNKLVTKLWPVPHEFSREMQDEAFVWLDQQMDHIPINKGQN